MNDCKLKAVIVNDKVVAKLDAGIGAYVVPQSDIDNLIYNSTNNYRVLIRPFIPF